MPRVPVYNQPQESLRPLPTPAGDGTISSGVLGAPAQAQIEAGRALTQGATPLVDIAVNMQLRQNADMLHRAETALKDEWITYEQEARKSRQGAYAKDFTSDTNKWWDEKIKHHLSNMENNEQRRLLERRAGSLRQQSVHSASLWEQAQTERAEAESWSASKNATISAAAATPNPERIEWARDEIVKMNRLRAVQKGWKAEQLQGEVLKDTTELHKQVIQGLARTNPVAAQQYFDKFKSEIDGKQHAEIGAFAERVSANAIGEQTAASVWIEIGPKSDREPVQLDKLEEKLRAVLKGNEPALDSAIKRMRERASAFKDSRRERDDQLESAVNLAIMNGASRAQIARMPAFNQLSPEAARKIDSYMENKAASQESRAAARESREYTRERRRLDRLTLDGMDEALRTSDPAVLTSMTRDQVVNLLPKLGPEHTQRLVAKWETLTKDPEKLTEAKMDNDAFNVIAEEFKLSPNEKLKGAVEAQRVGRLVAARNAVEAAIGEAQKASGKKLSREEKDEIARKTLSNQVLYDKGWLYPERPMPAAAILPSDLRHVQVPAAAREEIAEQLRKRGKPVTDDEIAHWYLIGVRRGAYGR